MTYTRLDSPTGEITILGDDRRITSIAWDATEDDIAGHAYEPDDPLLRRAAGQLQEYFGGERFDFDLPLGPAGTAFQLAAWEQLRTIPYGQTISYGEQARRMGDARKARAVGGANGRNPLPVVVPCHRVVGSTGALTGFSSGIERKVWLLDHERRHAG